MQVWTSLSTYPTTKKFVQTFFLEKVWLQNTLPTYSLDICPKFRSFFIWDPLLNTWEQLPLLAVLKSAIRTANLGSSIHTFFCGLELPPLAVLWSLQRTADLGSSNGTFRPW